MNWKRTLGRRLLDVFPKYNDNLYQFCARYVDRFNGDNNSDPEGNGEYFFLRNALSKVEEGVIFDVGANVGNWAAFALTVNPRLNLHCFEPGRATYAKLAQREWSSTVRLNNLGLGDIEGTLELHVVDEESGLSSVYVRHGVDSTRFSRIESVTITTIDEYCEKNAINQIDLLKVDVEGHEYAVFRGMNKILTKGIVRAIQFEYGGCNLDAKVSLGDIWVLLESHGFRLFKLYPEGPRRVKKYQQRLETFKYSNWLAIHEEHGRIYAP